MTVLTMSSFFILKNVNLGFDIMICVHYASAWFKKMPCYLETRL